MLNNGISENEHTIDWDNLLNNLPDDLNFDFLDDPATNTGVVVNEFSTSPDSDFSLTINDIEQYFFEEEDSNHQEALADEFFSDLLVDSPPDSGLDQSKDSSSSPETVEENEKIEDKPKKIDTLMQTNESNEVVDIIGDKGGDYDDQDDPAAKKRKRKMRNKDAAVRSRERKKSYVNDLEIKKRYFEGECKRLGIVLQYYLAENQALRLSLHNSKAFDASMTKQESAVLLLESLLLGSLLWFLGVMCLLILPFPFPLLSALENVDREEWERRVAQRKTGSDKFRISVIGSSLMGKRCKASRSRMKPCFLLGMMGSIPLSMRT